MSISNKFNKSIFINWRQFEAYGNGIAIFSGLLGYEYQFLELKNTKAGISTSRAYFTPPTHWLQQQYHYDIYYITSDDSAGQITLSFGINTLKMKSDVTTSNEFSGNSSGGFQFGGSVNYNIPIVPNTNNTSFKRPLQKYRISQYMDFSGIDFASLNIGRYMNQNLPYSDTYNGSVYIVGVKISQA